MDITRNMCVFNSAVPRLDTASIENTVAFQFDDSPLLLLSIQVNIEHACMVCSSYTWACTILHSFMH